jgi:uncharacterized protein (DUF1501 family)
MRRIALLFVLITGLAAASAARSQQPANSHAKSATPKDSVVFKPSAELQKSLDQLAASVQALAQRIASDPEIKTAAMNVASGFVTTAQQVIAEQSGVLEEALKKAAQQINAAQKDPQTPTKK